MQTRTHKSKATSIYNYTQTITITIPRQTRAPALLLLLTNTHTHTDILSAASMYVCVRVCMQVNDRKLTTQQIFSRFWCRRHFVFLCIVLCGMYGTILSYSSRNSLIVKFIFILNTSV